MFLSCRLLCLVGLLCLTGLSAFTTEEQALLQFAEQIGNFDEVYNSSHWQGWGRDSNILCPSTEVNTDNDYLCFPNYPGTINATSQSWTGVVCTPNGTVLCVSLAGWGLTGNVNVLEELVPLQDMQLLNLANNSLTGSLPDMLPAQLNDLDPGNVSLGYIFLSNNSISGSLPAVWGDAVNGWGQFIKGLYLDTNQLTGQLPQLWSDSNSLSNLFRVDLFLNQMTGPVAWNPVNLPSLGNLVLLPGNKFCGTVPSVLDGVVRDLTATIGINQVLTNVTRFKTACGSDSSQRSASKGAIAGTLCQDALQGGSCAALWVCFAVTATASLRWEHVWYDMLPSQSLATGTSYVVSQYTIALL
ncbi:TPA: Pollen receptor-like kinase 3, variant 2 [Trebouxia sp. C0004]